MNNGKGLIVNNVGKVIDNNIILKSISFKVEPGEILAIVGESGSGKTTLLKTINRMIEIEKGEILLNGASIKKMNPIELRRQACMLLQTPTMLNGTVKDNIEYGLKLRSIHANQNPKEDIQHILQAVRDSGLHKKFLSKDATKLSGGEQQRVALARLLVLEPKVLLLDEPTAAMDPKLTKIIEKTIIELCKKRNLVILWITHNHSQARRVGDRIGVLRNGSLKVLANSNQTKLSKNSSVDTKRRHG
jgi:ABC-type phosphate transport system ATPase subunit